MTALPILAHDLELVALAKGGDAAAFERLVLQYQDRLVNALTHHLADVEAAREIAQEALLKAYLRLGEFRGDSQFYTWLFAIARNAAMSLSRAARARVRGVSLEEAPVPSSPDDPVRRAMSRDTERLVHEALQRLDEEARWLVVLRDIDGRDYTEIAGTLGLPLGTVKSRLHRARMRLRELLEGRV